MFLRALSYSFIGETLSYLVKTIKHHLFAVMKYTFCVPNVIVNKLGYFFPRHSLIVKNGPSPLGSFK